MKSSSNVILCLSAIISVAHVCRGRVSKCSYTYICVIVHTLPWPFIQDSHVELVLFLHGFLFLSLARLYTVQ